MDGRFTVHTRGKDCLNCGHHVFANKAISCNHPDRPSRPVEIIRWAAGCPQHIPLKNPQ